MLTQFQVARHLSPHLIRIPRSEARAPPAQPLPPQSVRQGQWIAEESSTSSQKRHLLQVTKNQRVSTSTASLLLEWSTGT